MSATESTDIQIGHDETPPAGRELLGRLASEIYATYRAARNREIAATNRIRETAEMLDWIRHYEVIPMMFGDGIIGLQCRRHEDTYEGVILRPGTREGPDGSVYVVFDERRVTLDELLDLAAAHEIGAHGD